MFYLLIDRNNNIVPTQAVEWDDAQLADEIMKVETGVYKQPGANWVDKVMRVEDSFIFDVMDEALDLVLGDFDTFGSEVIPNILLANEAYAELANDKILAAHDGEDKFDEGLAEEKRHSKYATGSAKNAAKFGAE